MMGNLRSADGASVIVRLWLGASLCVLLVAACSAQPLQVTREATTLRLTAADSCMTLLQDASAAYEASHPWVTVTSEVLNNALAVEAVQEGEANLALLSWGSVGEEREQTLWVEPFARDGVAVIVSPASPILEISLAELREIFLGRLQERQGVVLTIVSREDGSGARAAFESMVLQGEDTSLNALVMPSSEAVIDYVANTPSAIGYVSTQCLDDRVRAVPVEGVAPTEETIANGSYPLWRELYMVSRGEPTGEARQFAQWLLRRGDATDMTHGMVPREP